MNRVNLIINSKPKNYYNCQRSEMLEFIPKGCIRVLEVGCGSGVFGKILKDERNIEVWGVEACETAGKETIGKLDKVLIGDIENVRELLPSDYFDCIVFNDSLEHFKDPWYILRSVKENLCVNGWIVASIPNMRFFPLMKDLLLDKKWQYLDAGILDRTHLHFFTIESIKDLFSECGYDIMKVEGIHPIRFSWKFNILNWILLRKFNDMRYYQFACVVRKH